MNTKHIIPLAATFLLAAFSQSLVLAQEYVAPKVTISKEKVRSGGKVFYSHVVQERQTIYSISKAYGVTMEEIYDANPALKLETEGLKKDQILLIPFKGEVKEVVEPEVQQPDKVEMDSEGDTDPDDDDEYFIHRVKWYEDLDAIAKKYKVSKESIKNINRMTSDKVKRKQDLKIPRNPAAWEGRTVAVEQEEQDVPEVVRNDAEDDDDNVTVAPDENEGGILDDLFVREGRHDVNISILLPFSASKLGDRTSFMDFYSGALLA